MEIEKRRILYMMGDAKHACVNCHFLVVADPNGYVVGNDRRARIRKRDYLWLDSGFLACDFGVWHEGMGQPTDSDHRHTTIVTTNRKDFCFFWKYHPGMQSPAAKELQKREADNREASRDRRLTVIGLWVATIALVVDTLMQVSKLFGWIK
jgi:hypothetical protein